MRLQLTGQLPFGPNDDFPFITWGPYWWANGQIANPSDTYPFTTGLNGLTWNCWEFCADGQHPSEDEDVCGRTGLIISGAQKAATMLFEFWSNDELAKQWFTPRPAISVSDPPNGQVDHLQDFKLVSGQLVEEGTDEVTITFNGPVQRVGGGSVEGCLTCFEVTSTCQTLPDPCPNDDMPAIESVTAGPSSNSFIVKLTRQIVPGHWTTIRAIVERLSAPNNPIRVDPLDRVELGFIPGDADGNRETNVADLTRIEEVIEAGGGGFNPNLHDQNRDEQLTIADRQREQQLLNGTDTTQPWNGVELHPRP